MQTSYDDVEDGDPDVGRYRVTPGRVLAGLLIAASFSVWVYAFSGFADRTKPDTLDDPAFALSGEPICAVTITELEALPNALDAVDQVDRARQIRTANGLLSSMIDSLAEEVVGTDRDVQISTDWLADWQTYLADRDDYADRIEVDPNAQLFVGAVGGERLERRITRFANTNKMYSCVTPSDVG